MLGPEVAAKGVAALAAAAFALAVGLPRAGGRSARSLAAFLALIAANQFVEMLRAAGDPADLTLARAAAVFAALDPLALLVFAGSLPGVAPPRRATIALVAAGSAAFALAGGWWMPDDTIAQAWYALALNLFTLAVYSAILAAIARAAFEHPVLRPLVAAMAIATLPLGPRTLDTAISVVYLVRDAGRLTGVSISVVVGVAILVAHARSVARRAPAPWHLLWPALAVGGLLLTYPLADILAVLGAPVDTRTPLLLGRSGAALRWLLFGALASVAIIREDLLGFDLPARRRAARVLIASGVFAVITVAATIASLVVPDILDVRPVDLLFLFAILALTQGFRGSIDRVASAAYGIPRAGAGSAHDRYREAVARVAAKGCDPARDEGLARMRHELAIEPGTADVIHRLAEEEAPIVLAPEQLVAGRYRVVAPAVHGAAGRAFLVRDTLMERDVVLKELRARSDDEQLRAARLASAVHHRNLVTVFNVLRRADATLLVEEACGGGTLSQRMPLAREEGARVVADVLAGLAELHASGIVHGDLRAANVLLAADGTAKLVDFGLVRAAPADDVAAAARLAQETAPGVREDVVLRALEGGFRDARAMLEAWRA